MRKLDARQLTREKSLFRYSSALERADFNTVAAVLEEAEHDPLLARMIAEVNTVYESEIFRPSPSLNHASNHHKKDYLMTTMVLSLPKRQRPMQRWLPLTLAAACISMLFIGALVLRPIRPGNIEAGMQIQATGTPKPAASPTIVPTATALNALLIVTVPPTPVADCTSVINTDQGPVPLYLTVPDPSGTVVGYVTSQVFARLYDKVSLSNGDVVWYFVNTAEANPQSGWVSDKALLSNVSDCFTVANPVRQSFPVTVVPSDANNTADIATTIQQAYTLYTQAKFADAATLYEQVLRAEPTNIDALYGYGRVLIELDHPNEAESIGAQILQINPKALNGYSLKAEAQLKNGDAASALIIAQIGYEISSKDAPLLSVMAQIYTALDRNDEALRFGQAAVTANNSDADAHSAYGLALVNAGKNDKAIQELESAIHFNTNQVSTYDALAKLYKASNKLDSALALYDKLLSLQPANVNVLISLCETYSEAGKIDTAESYCDKAVALDPNNAEAYQIRGGVLFRNRNYEMALQDFKQCASLGSRAVECYYQGGLASFYMGNCDDAWASLQQSLPLVDQSESPVQTIIMNGLGLVKQDCPKYKDAALPNIPAPTAVVAQAGTLPSTDVPQAIAEAPAVGTPVCAGPKVMIADSQVHARPSDKSSAVAYIKAGTQVEVIVTGTAAEDNTSGSNDYWFFIKADVDGSSVQGWVNANSTQPLDPTTDCNTNLITINATNDAAVGSSGGVVAAQVPPSLTCKSNNVVILSPTNNSVIAGKVTVAGIATAPNFGSYQLEIIGLGTGSKYLQMATKLQPVISAGPLAQLDFSSYPPDNYGLRLSVLDAAQQVQASCLVNVTVARAAVPEVVVSGIAQATAIPANVLPISGVVVTGVAAHTSPATNSELGITLTAGVVVNIDQQSADGKWSHFVLDGGKNGWVLSSVLQPQTIIASSDASGWKGIVSVVSTVRERPDDRTTAIGTVESGTLVTVNNSSVDGLWNHIILEDATQGWIYASQVQPVTQTTGQATDTSIGMTGIVNVEQTVLRDKPDENARMIRTLQHNVTLTVMTTANDGQWANVILPDGTQGWLPSGDLQTEVPLQVMQPAALCYGTIGAQPAQIYSRPAYSGSGVSLGTLQPGTLTSIVDVDNQSGNTEAWYFVSGSVQGWVSGSAFTDVNYCASPSSPPDQFTAVVATPVPVDPVPAAVLPATLIPADVTPVFSIAGTPICTGIITINGTISQVSNQTDTDATIFAAPLTTNSNAVVVGTFTAKSQATLLNQQNDPQSAGSIGALWYLIMTNDSNEKQVTGWVSANSINSSGTCASEVTGGSSGASTVLPAQLKPVPTAVPNAAAATQLASCQITNPTNQSVPIYTVPLTQDPNAEVIGEFTANSSAIVISQNDDLQSTGAVGARWYLITTIGDQPGRGWISAISIRSAEDCAPQQVTAIEAVPASGIAVPMPSSGSADTMPTGICTVSVQQNESVQVFSGPSHKDDEAALVNNLPPDMPATVLYQKQNKDTGVVWYLILAVSKEGKEISGWVSADTVKMVSRCPALP